MTMTTIKEKNGTGIYVQKSAGVTTAGDGLALKRSKSPVAYIEESKFKVNQSEGTQDYPHYSGQSRISMIKGDYTSDQKKPVVAREIAAGSSYVSGPKKIKRFYHPLPVVQIFTSPAIKAGATEEDCLYSQSGRKRKSEHLRRVNEERNVDGFDEVRRRMGLRGRHISHRNSSSDSPLPAGSSYSRKKYKEENTKFPFEVQIINRSNPFGEISFENHSLLLNALETTVLDGRVIERNNKIKLGPCKYKRKILVVCCKNEETVRFLEAKIPLYNRLWPGADLFLTRDNFSQKRYKVRVRLPNYNLTTEEFFKIIGKQNGFPAEYWSLMHKMEAKGFFALFGVDKATYEHLKESNGFVYFFFDKILFELEEK